MLVSREALEAGAINQSIFVYYRYDRTHTSEYTTSEYTTIYQ